MRLLNGPIKSRDCSLDTYRTISRPLRLKRIHTRRMRFAATIRAFAILHTVRCKSGGKSANASYRPPHIGDAPVRGLTRRSLIFSHMHCIRTMGAILATLVGTPRLSLPFASAAHGHRPHTARAWSMDRSERPLGRGTSLRALARGVL